MSSIERETPVPNELGSTEDIDWDDEGEDFSNLLGFDFAAEEGADRSGLRALINSAIISHRRLPMLDVIFDRAARRMSTSLRQFTDENVEVTLDDVTSIRFGDFIADQGNDVIIGVVRSAKLDGYFLVAADGALIYSIVDLLLGGRRDMYSTGEAERQLTAIELGLAQRMLALLVSGFDESFKVVQDAEMVLERVETTPRFAAIVQEPSVCALAKFKVQVAGMESRISIVAPHASIESVKETLLRDFVGDSKGTDEIWHGHIQKEANATDLSLDVVLCERTVPLGDLKALEVGSYFNLGLPATSDVKVKSGKVVLGTGKVGRANGRLAVRLGDPIDSKELKKQIDLVSVEAMAK